MRSLTALLEFPDKRLVDHGIENDAGVLLDVLQNALQLALRAHKRMHVLDRADVLILHGRSLRDRDQRLACRIRNEVHVEHARQRHSLRLAKKGLRACSKPRRYPGRAMRDSGLREQP